MAVPRIRAKVELTGENASVITGKGAIGKPSTRASTRQALGTITNRGNISAPVTKGLKEKVLKATKAVVPKKPTAQRVTRIPKVEQPEQKTEENPMDISANEAYSMRNFDHVKDIDKEDHGNPQLVSEYVNEIYDYMRLLESQMQIKTKYLDGCEINGRMRHILVDWLVQVHLRFHLLQETLYLTVAIIDRFLQVQEVSKSKLQLVGVTAMLVASKYEEMYAPEVKDFVYITEEAFSSAEIRKMEVLMLKTLDFNLGKPLPLHFLRRNSKAGNVDATTHTLAKYLMELTIVEYDMVHIDPSRVAAASLCLAQKSLTGTSWSDTLTYYSKYSEEDLSPVVQKIAHLVTKAGTGKLTSIKTKYSSSKFAKISACPELNSDVVKSLAAKTASS